MTNALIEKGEIIIYQPDDKSTQLEVRIDEETVWLSQNQMVELFSSTKQNISRHINNVFIEGELDPKTTVKDYLTVQLEGSRKVRRKITIYSLDIIISVGYRVKSQRGTLFRIWANRILKDYLLKGYIINQRIDNIEKKLLEHDQKFNSQYSAIEVKPFTKSHDRFLIIDNTSVYHIGASLKDLDKKWFAFAKIELDALEMIKRLK